jgi:hypothetical protein
MHINLRRRVNERLARANRVRIAVPRAQRHEVREEKEQA